jgi:hypothetical protein
MKIKTEIEILQGRIRAVTGRSAFVKYCDTDDEALFRAQQCSTVDANGIINDCQYLDGTGECSYQDSDSLCPMMRKFWVVNHGEARALEVCGEAKSEDKSNRR